MNIFIMILMAIFMLGYYMTTAPSTRIPQAETEYAARRADLHSVAQCATAVHNAKIRGTEFNDVCVEQNGITSQLYCMNASRTQTKCEIVKNKRPAYSYIVTTTAPITTDDYNSMMEIMEEYYADAGTFGLLMDGNITSGGLGTQRTVPPAMIKDLELTDGQLVYLTQYEIPDATTNFVATDGGDVRCPAGTVKTYRFGRWQCIGYNPKTDCGGDMIWDSDLLECVADESRKPLCAGQQTAVLVDDVWECINPFSSKTCPGNMVARLDYNTMEWECVADDNATNTKSKCDRYSSGVVYGAIGATLRAGQTSCTDCEKMILDDETCTSYCVPDPAQVDNPACYAGARECRGASRAFYFGFPNTAYAANVSELQGQRIPMDRMHSQNRRFNCLDCGDGEIDTEKSITPYTAFCK